VPAPRLPPSTVPVVTDLNCTPGVQNLTSDPKNTGRYAGLIAAVRAWASTCGVACMGAGGGGALPPRLTRSPIPPTPVGSPWEGTQFLVPPEVARFLGALPALSASPVRRPCPCPLPMRRSFCRHEALHVPRRTLANTPALQTPPHTHPSPASQVYSLSQCVTAPLWGGVADRIGRKPTLLLVR
jgi:hypothetical protein